MRSFSRIVLIVVIAGVVGILWGQVLPSPFSIIAAIISGAFIGHYGYDIVTK